MNARNEFEEWVKAPGGCGLSTAMKDGLYTDNAVQTAAVSYSAAVEKMLDKVDTVRDQLDVLWNETVDKLEVAGEDNTDYYNGKLDGLAAAIEAWDRVFPSETHA